MAVCVCKYLSLSTWFSLKITNFSLSCNQRNSFHVFSLAAAVTLSFVVLLNKHSRENYTFSRHHSHAHTLTKQTPCFNAQERALQILQPNLCRRQQWNNNNTLKRQTAASAKTLSQISDLAPVRSWKEILWDLSFSVTKQLVIHSWTPAIKNRCSKQFHLEFENS